MTLTERDAPAAEPQPESGAAPVESGNRARVFQLLGALALISVVFVLTGLGYLLLFIAILIAIVMLHELGHFATAKWAGM